MSSKEIGHAKVMNKALIQLCCYCIISFYSFGQIEINIDKAPNGFIYLQQLKGERHYTIDSTIVQNGKLIFEWKLGYSPGMFHITDRQNGCVFLATDKEIKLKTIWPTLQDSLLIIKSPENELWQQYISRRNETNIKLELLSPVLSYYPEETSFYRTATKEFLIVQDSLHEWVDKISNKESSCLASHFIRADMKPKVPVQLSIVDQKKFFKEHYFDNVNWNDTLLIYSNVLTNKITEYLGLYANPNMSKAELEQAFSYAIDQVLPLSMENDQMYAFCLDYLVRGFERFHFDEVLLHIANNYEPPGRCENEERKSEIEKRLDKYSQFVIGKIAPDIRLPDLNRDTVSLNEINKPYKLVLFWASWCPHCMEILPKLNFWYKTQNAHGVEIYSVSLDFNKEELESALIEQPIPWIVVSDYNGWESSAAIDYNVYATPTMFLLDKSNKILAKPITFNEFLKSTLEL